LFQVSATDDDITKAYKQITYIILEGNNGGTFSIDGASGKIKTNRTFEKMGHFEASIVIKAEDGVL